MQPSAHDSIDSLSADQAYLNYIAAYGPIPADHCLIRDCDTPTCVKPAHFHVKPPVHIVNPFIRS